MSHKEKLNKPWVSESLKNEIRKKKTLYQKAKRSKTETDWSAFKQQKSKVLALVRIAKLDYISKHPEEEAELSKPWVNESLKAEILKKLELYQKAKQSNAEADWTEFKSQKSKVVTMLQAAKLEYIGNHPEQDVDKIMAEVNKNSKK